MAFLLGVADHHANIVAAALNALDLFTIKRPADLSCEVELRQAKQSSLVTERELNLLFTGAERIGDVVHTLIRSEFLPQRSRCRSELLCASAAKLDVDGLAR